MYSGNALLRNKCCDIDSHDAIANITPVTPPNKKLGIKANENNIGDSKVIRPLYNVNNQLNNLTPVGTPINIVEIEKNELIKAPLPIVKKW